MLSLILIVCLISFKIKIYAMEGKFTLSPDGKAFTTSAGDRNTRWYDQGYEVKTGISGASGSIDIGEHEFNWERRGVVPVKSWKVAWTRGQCIHNGYLEGNQYHGVTFGRKNCYQPYYSGWFAYCADCGEVVVNCLFYMSDDVAKSMKSLDCSKAYYYKCPHCDNLEIGADLMVHYCKGVSANRYFVRYNANFGSGSMERSSHMVNNATIYEGQTVTPQTRLNLNTYTREGYEFVGWNTQKDGSGKSYEDGATIYNLCMEENASIILYAQWKKRSSILEIDPNGGNYQGKEGIQRITGYYNAEYYVNRDDLTTPRESTVHFNTMGGGTIPDMFGKYVFTGWDIGHPFYGRLKDDIYTFLGEDGTVDRIVANYEQVGIILPEAYREGYSFGGWYADEIEMTFIGQSGERFFPNGEITLYASWIDLKLVSKDNYTANQGKGAVDLSWSQKDSRNKVYAIFQKKEDGVWGKVHDAEVNSSDFQLEKTIFYSGSIGQYTVPYTGFYTLYLSGAQGENFGEYIGGFGGSVEATIYLNKGEKLEFIIGGQNGYGEGGKGTKYGNGGGYSKVIHQDKGILLIAGGGGGATGAANGGAGGSSLQVTDESKGKVGEAGGGAGYHGGGSGSAVFHEHTKECEHVHTGTPLEYGGCYTKVINCGSTEIEYQVTHSSFVYKNVGSDGNLAFCFECNSYDCIGHLTEYGVYVCKQCGRKNKYPISICTENTEYAPACGKEAYVCNLQEGQLISHIPSEGGSNYVNKAYCIEYKEEKGMQAGNGTLIIISKHLGIREKQEYPGIVATDMATPEPVDIKSISKTAVSDHEIRVAWNRPKDNGTDYYHQVKSYAKEDMELISESNITKNTLVSQVVGYRYLIDIFPETKVDDTSLYLADNGNKAFLVVPTEDESKYLHLAAQDKAGNIGPAIHISISNEDLIYWPIITEELVIKDGENVASAMAPNTYFVKADASSPIQLTLEGLLCGTARKEYQIDVGDFVIQSMENSKDKGIFSVLVPKREKIDIGNHTYQPDSLLKKMNGQCGIEDALYTWAQRYNICRSLTIIQKFTVSKEMDGKTLRIMPRVAVQGEKETIYSNEESDLLNSVYLIGDAYGPYINGTQELEQFSNSEQTHADKMLVKLEAGDTGSGLAQFYVEVFNHDNTLSKRLEDEELLGQIVLQLDPQEPIYQGDFTVLVYAKDRVGNETAMHSGMLNVGVDAYVSRVLEPQTPIFKRGESGVLHISSWGYVERVEVYFPNEFTNQDSSLNRKYVYEVPGYLKREEIPFVVPLSAPEGSITIKVTAYKDGVEYQADPQLITMKVQGDVRDELRTRLR